MEKLNPMIKASSVRLALIISAKSSLSSSGKGRFLPMKAPICTESHKISRESAKNVSGRSSSVFTFVPPEFVSHRYECDCQGLSYRTIKETSDGPSDVAIGGSPITGQYCGVAPEGQPVASYILFQLDFRSSLTMLGASRVF